MKCRHCNNRLIYEVIDLNHSPISNDLLSEEEMIRKEVYYPLTVMLCSNCFLLQVDEFKKTTDIFSKEYVYFSSYSETWLKHAKKYVNQMIERYRYNSDNLVVEIASNDGYLLQYFLEKKIPVLGVEPTQNTAKVAIKKGINTIIAFFSEKFALKHFSDKKADLLIGNNVLAHVPDLNGFIKGLKIALATKGIITLEFPHVVNMLKYNQFDTIYHEHFSYFSLYTVKKIFEKYNLSIFDVQEIPTHGGSLRVFIKHTADISKNIEDSVKKILDKENIFGITNISSYMKFKDSVRKVKYDFMTFLLESKSKNKKIAGYGAAAKGNTLLNYCGIKKDLIDFCVDTSPHKQGKYLPGSHIPIVGKEEIKLQKPDFVIIFPWNIKEEIIRQHNYIRKWGGKFVIVIPELIIF